MARQLPRGRHGLSPKQVAEDQLQRIVAATGEIMGERGYLNTSVADIISRAGVSRETFYRLFDNKLDCFLGAFDAIATLLVDHLRIVLAEGVEASVSAYFDLLASEPRYARLFLVEVHAVGEAAIARRAEVQQLIATSLADALGWDTDPGRFAATSVVAAVSAMVTGPIISGDPAAIRGLGPKVLDHIKMIDSCREVSTRGNGYPPA